MTETETEVVRLTADVVLLALVAGQRHVLLVKRRWAPFEGRWALPGGHVDAGEEVDAAAWRELFEETGLTADRLELLNVYAAPGRDPRGRYVDFAFVGVVRERLLPCAGDDAAEARWWSVHEAEALPLAFDHGRTLSDALDWLET